MKRLLYLSAALVALVVVAWASGMFGGPASTVELPELVLGSGDEATRVDVRSGDSRVGARRLESGEWMLDVPVEAKADTTTVMRLARSIQDMNLESIVSSNAERFGRFQVDSTGNRLILEWDDRRLDLLVGKMGPDFQSRYVRLEGDNRIMLANNVPNLSANIDQWRDKVLWTWPKPAVERVFVEIEDGGSYGLVKADTGWNLQVGSETLAADSSVATRLVESLSSLKADGFHTGLTIDSVLTRVTHQVRLELADGRSETLVMSKRSSDVAAVREGSGDVFKLFSHRLTNLTPDLEQITESGNATEAR